MAQIGGDSLLVVGRRTEVWMVEMLIEQFHLATSSIQDGRAKPTISLDIRRQKPVI
jgi:hypothetical protein